MNYHPLNRSNRRFSNRVIRIIQKYYSIHTTGSIEYATQSAPQHHHHDEGPLYFLLQSEKMESIHPSFFVEALSDWVPRLLKSIEDATFITIQHKRRAASPAFAGPPTTLSTPSTSLMALMYDAMCTETDTTPVPSTPPRFKVCVIDKHTYNKVIRRLEYNVHWEGVGSVTTNEPYYNIHHLDALGKYERTIQPSKGNRTSGTGRATTRKWEAYML
jgi:hypothetical protein